MSRLLARRRHGGDDLSEGDSDSSDGSSTGASDVESDDDGSVESEGSESEEEEEEEEVEVKKEEGVEVKKEEEVEVKKEEEVEVKKEVDEGSVIPDSTDSGKDVDGSRGLLWGNSLMDAEPVDDVKVEGEAGGRPGRKNISREGGPSISKPSDVKTGRQSTTTKAGVANGRGRDANLTTQQQGKFKQEQGMGRGTTKNPGQKPKQIPTASPTGWVTTDQLLHSQQSSGSSSDTGGDRPSATTTESDEYTRKLKEDPSFTPNTGKFWLHDDRFESSGSRGRGRGGFRGRGRGLARPSQRDLTTTTTQPEKQPQSNGWGPATTDDAPGWGTLPFSSSFPNGQQRHRMLFDEHEDDPTEQPWVHDKFEEVDQKEPPVKQYKPKTYRESNATRSSFKVGPLAVTITKRKSMPEVRGKRGVDGVVMDERSAGSRTGGGGVKMGKAGSGSDNTQARQPSVETKKVEDTATLPPVTPAPVEPRRREQQQQRPSKRYLGPAKSGKPAAAQAPVVPIPLDDKTADQPVIPIPLDDEPVPIPVDDTPAPVIAKPQKDEPAPVDPAPVPVAVSDRAPTVPVPSGDLHKAIDAPEFMPSFQNHHQYQNTHPYNNNNNNGYQDSAERGNGYHPKFFHQQQRKRSSKSLKGRYMRHEDHHPMAYPDYPAYSEYGPADDFSSPMGVTLTPIMTSSGQIVLMTDQGLMVPAEQYQNNYMYAAAPTPYHPPYSYGDASGMVTAAAVSAPAATAAAYYGPDGQLYYTQAPMYSTTPPPTMLGSVAPAMPFISNGMYVPTTSQQAMPPPPVPLKSKLPPPVPVRIRRPDDHPDHKMMESGTSAAGDDTFLPSTAAA